MERKVICKKAYNEIVIPWIKIFISVRYFCLRIFALFFSGCVTKRLRIAEPPLYLWVIFLVSGLLLPVYSQNQFLEAFYWIEVYSTDTHIHPYIV